MTPLGAHLPNQSLGVQAPHWIKPTNMARNLKPSRLGDWLRVPTPMRAIRVRAWVEVVGFVMEFISFQSSMKCENFFSRHLV